MEIKEDENVQYENIIHTRCPSNNKVSTLIIDRGSFTNVAGTSLVEKLNLTTLQCPTLYKLQWLNNCEEVKVNE